MAALASLAVNLIFPARSIALFLVRPICAGGPDRHQGAAIVPVIERLQRPRRGPHGIVNEQKKLAAAARRKLGYERRAAFIRIQHLRRIERILVASQVTDTCDGFEPWLAVVAPGRQGYEEPGPYFIDAETIHA